MTEPSNGEVMRELARVASQLQELAQQLRDDRNAAADTYVRKDVHKLTTDAHDRRLDELETENTDREKAADQFRRQIIVGLVLLAVPALMSLVLGVNNLLTTGGVP